MEDAAPPFDMLAPELWALIAFFMSGYACRRVLDAVLTRTFNHAARQSGGTEVDSYLDGAAGPVWRAAVGAALVLAGAAPPRTLAGLAWARAGDEPSAAWLRECDPAPAAAAAFAARAVALTAGVRVTVVDALACRWADTPAAAAPLAAAVVTWCDAEPGAGILTGSFAVARQLSHRFGDEIPPYGANRLVVPGVAMHQLIYEISVALGSPREGGNRCDRLDLHGAQLADYVYLAMTGYNIDELFRDAYFTDQVDAARWLARRPGVTLSGVAMMARQVAGRPAAGAVVRQAREIESGPPSNPRGWFDAITTARWHRRHCVCHYCSDADTVAATFAAAGDVATLMCLPFERRRFVCAAAVDAGQVAAAAWLGGGRGRHDAAAAARRREEKAHAAATRAAAAVTARWCAANRKRIITIFTKVGD